MSDPVWLPDVLRAAGLRCDVFAGAFDRGHGDFGAIWGILDHHTGSFGASPGSIANHPSLGLASQLHLAANGVYTLCGVGVAWHAGTGSWPGIQANNANQVTIGIEAANDGTSGWSDAQYDAYVLGNAAILKKLGQNSSHTIGHKEWGAIQGKWDPGGIDMKLFRQRVQSTIDKGTPVVRINLIELEAKENPWVGVRHAKPGAEGETPVGKDGKGRFVEYDNAHIYFHPAIGAFVVPHADPKIPGSGIFDAWARRGYESGPLGYPVRDFAKISAHGINGAVQAFQGGVLYVPDTKYSANVVRGVIGQRWALEGYEKGPLGWPITEEVDNGTGGKRQEFQFGSLEWDPSGAVKKIGAEAASNLTLVDSKGIPLAVSAVDLVAA